MKKLLLISFILSLGVNASALAADWRNDIQEAVKYSNYNRINVIAASNPDAQGEIALFLLQKAQESKASPDQDVKLFAAATPFVGRIPAADASKASDVVRAHLELAANPDFQKKYPRQAGDIFVHALYMSGQPNIVAYDPTLHAEVLEAANDFIKRSPSDADKKLLEEISLAQAGGAPETTPVGVIEPSAE